MKTRIWMVIIIILAILYSLLLYLVIDSRCMPETQADMGCKITCNLGKDYCAISAYNIGPDLTSDVSSVDVYLTNVNPYYWTKTKGLVDRTRDGLVWDINSLRPGEAQNLVVWLDQFLPGAKVKCIANQGWGVVDPNQANNVDEFWFYFNYLPLLVK